MPTEKKMKLSELLTMQEESLEYCIVTSEMQMLGEYLKKAN